MMSHRESSFFKDANAFNLLSFDYHLVEKADNGVSSSDIRRGDKFKSVGRNRETGTQEPTARGLIGEPYRDDVNGGFRLFVGGFTSSITPGRLKDFFLPYGGVKDVTVKGKFAFVSMETVTQCQSAAAGLGGKNVEGSELKISWARTPRFTSQPQRRPSVRGSVAVGTASIWNRVPEGSVKLIVKGLVPTFDVDVLKTLFSKYGTVVDVLVLDDSLTGGKYAVVVMSSGEEGHKACDELDGREFDGSRLAVYWNRRPQSTEQISRELLEKSVKNPVMKIILPTTGSQLAIESSEILSNIPSDSISGAIVESALGGDAGLALNRGPLYQETAVFSILPNIDPDSQSIERTPEKTFSEPCGQNTLDMVERSQESGALENRSRQLRGKPCPDRVNGGFRLYVCNVASSTTTDRLAELFTRSGQVNHIEVKENCRGKFAYISMQTVEQCERAVAELKGKDVDGSRLKIYWKRFSEITSQSEHHQLIAVVTTGMSTSELVDSIKLTVKGFGACTSIDSLKQLFGKYGNVLDVILRNDPQNGLKYANVFFKSEEEAEKASVDLDRSVFEGSKIYVYRPRHYLNQKENVGTKDDVLEQRLLPAEIPPIMDSINKKNSDSGCDSVPAASNESSRGGGCRSFDNQIVSDDSSRPISFSISNNCGMMGKPYPDDLNGGFKLLITGLASSIDSDRLKELLAKSGCVKHSFVKENDKGKFGFVSMETIEQCEAVAAEFIGKDVEGSRFRIYWARPRTGCDNINRKPVGSTCFKCGHFGHGTAVCPGGTSDSGFIPPMSVISVWGAKSQKGDITLLNQQKEVNFTQRDFAMVEIDFDLNTEELCDVNDSPDPAVDERSHDLSIAPSCIRPEATTDRPMYHIITNDQMRAQLKDTNDIVHSLELEPRSNQFMYLWKVVMGEKMWSSPGIRFKDRLRLIHLWNVVMREKLWKFPEVYFEDGIMLLSQKLTDFYADIVSHPVVPRIDNVENFFPDTLDISVNWYSDIFRDAVVNRHEKIDVVSNGDNMESDTEISLDHSPIPCRKKTPAVTVSVPIPLKVADRSLRKRPAYSKRPLKAPGNRAQTHRPAGYAVAPVNGMYEFASIQKVCIPGEEGKVFPLINWASTVVNWSAVHRKKGQKDVQFVTFDPKTMVDAREQKGNFDQCIKRFDKLKKKPPHNGSWWWQCGICGEEAASTGRKDHIEKHMIGFKPSLSISKDKNRKSACIAWREGWDPIHGAQDKRDYLLGHFPRIGLVGVKYTDGTKLEVLCKKNGNWSDGAKSRGRYLEPEDEAAAAAERKKAITEELTQTVKKNNIPDLSVPRKRGRPRHENPEPNMPIPKKRR